MGTKPVCRPCHRFFKPEKNGFRFTEHMPEGGFSRPESGQPNGWTPYKVWVGDLWRCDGCGAEIIVGTPLSPLSEHYKPGFEEFRATSKGDVYDC